MKCLACSNSLTSKQAGNITVDVCTDGCGGVWFDDREIRQVDEKKELGGETILALVSKCTGSSNRDEVRECPRCQGEVLCRRFYDVKNEVQIDQCLKCSGIWLDVGELGAIRGQYESEQDRYQAADKYLASQLALTKDQIKQGYEHRLQEWHEDNTFKGTLRELFAGFFGEK